MACLFEQEVLHGHVLLSQCTKDCLFIHSIPQSALPISFMSDDLGRLLLSAGCSLIAAMPDELSASERADAAGTAGASAAGSKTTDM